MPRQRGLADAEVAEVVVLGLRADVLHHLDHAHVAGMGDDPGDGPALGRVVLGVVEREAVHHDLVRHRVRAHRGLAAVLERGRGGDHLGRAARVEHVAHRQVRGIGQVVRVRRVERRGLRHGQDLPGVRVHHDHGAAARVGLLDPLRAGLLRLPLQAGQDGQPDVAPGNHGPAGLPGHRDGLAVAAVLHLLLPSRPASSGLSACSMPARPTGSPWALLVVKPTMFAARSPFGYTRV